MCGKQKIPQIKLFAKGYEITVYASTIIKTNTTVICC